MVHGPGWDLRIALKLMAVYGEMSSISSPSYPKSTIRCIPSPFINNKTTTAQVVTDLEMQDVVCRDFKVVYF